MHSSNNNFLVLQFLLTIASTSRKNAGSLTNSDELCYSCPAFDAHACTKVQKPRVCR